MRRRVTALVVLVALVGSACGDATRTGSPPAPPQMAVPNEPATLAELIGEWQPVPLFLDPVTRSRIEAACLQDMRAPQGNRATVIDVRGGRVATLRFFGMSSVDCNAIEIRADGTLMGAGAGVSGGPEPARQAEGGNIGRVEPLTVFGGTLDVQGWGVRGPVGPEIARVEISAQDVPTVVATLENGWFAAWWPARPGDPRPERGQRAPHTIRGYDAAGVLRFERPG